MFEDLNIFAIHDYDDKLKRQGAIYLKKMAKTLPELGDIADKMNKKGYGIFWVVNDFEGARKVENLTKINYWFCDIDGGNKEEQLARINSLALPPSFVVETFNGFHCYWAAQGKVDLQKFPQVQKALIDRLNGDKACKDPLRLLRCPGFFHTKNPAHPFFIKILDDVGSDMYYTEKQMLSYFVKPEQKQEYVTKPSFEKYIGDTKDFLNEEKWEKIFKVSDIVKGCRNSMLTRYTFWLKDAGLKNNEIDYVIRGLNRKSVSPLPESEVDSLLRTKGVRV